jgi:branched-chain amino acid transport system permease protein
MGGFGSSALQIPVPLWLLEASHIGSINLPNANFLALAAGVIVLLVLEWFLRRTRYGITIRAGVENREMVSALGIDVGRAFTVVFVIGGAMAGLAGLLYSVVFSGDLITPSQGDSLLIFAFIVVVIGGLGSIRGSAVAAVVVGLVQDYTSFYIGGHPGWAEIGNLSVVLLLALVLEWRPRGLFGSVV